MVSTANKILVAGGGPAGVEMAGELAEKYGKGVKEIIVLSGGSALLPRLNNTNISRDAQHRLEKMGVNIMHGAKVSSHFSRDGSEIVLLNNGSTFAVDAYIDATGDKPSSHFVPAEWLTESGQVKTDPETLRLDVVGVSAVYAYGSVGSYSDGSLMDVTLENRPSWRVSSWICKAKVRTPSHLLLAIHLCKLLTYYQILDLARNLFTKRSHRPPSSYLLVQSKALVSYLV
jgi:hypothetical protein